MKSKKCALRPVGQRSIASTFLFRTSNRSSDCKKNVEIKAPTQKGSQLSFSDFLNKKLHRGSVLPSSVQVKEEPCSSRLSDEHLNKSNIKKGGEAGAKFSIGDAFDLFKNVKNEKDDTRNSCPTDETEVIDIDEFKQTRKRRNVFEGDNQEKPCSRKRLAVLGEDSRPVQGSRKKAFATHEETKPLFNHYGNGRGWWSEDMEGVDNEEVGCTDSWEGVGSTTLGGIEWH
ncbi:hypothetical protein ACP275_14G035200 [Erythranthe tilingii]